jgi:hypothetical protein
MKMHWLSKLSTHGRLPLDVENTMPAFMSKTSGETTISRNEDAAIAAL